MKKILIIIITLMMMLYTLLQVNPIYAASESIKIYHTGDYAAYFEVYGQSGGSSGANGGLAGADFYKTSDGRVAYCLEGHKDCPSGDGLGYTRSDTDFLDDATYQGIVRILEHGYPVKGASALGVSSAKEARYATAMAIKMWMYKQKKYKPKALGVGYVCQPNKLKATSGHTDCYNLSKKLYNYAVNKTKISRTITVTNNNTVAKAIDGYYTMTSKVTLKNYTGYNLNKAALPSGSTVSGNNGKSGDTLTIKIPVKAATSGKTYSIKLTGKAKGLPSALFWSKPSKASYQKMVDVVTSVKVDTKSTSFSFKTPYMGQVQIIKKDAETGTTPQGEGTFTGTQFGLYDSSNKLLETLTITASGKSAVSKDYLPGTYTLKETKAGTGYIKNTKTFTVKIPEGSTLVYEVPNTIIKGKIAIEKYLDYPTSEDGKLSLGKNITFQIKSKKTGKIVDTLKTDDTGKALSKLLPYGVYIVNEESLDAYNIIKPFEVTINQNNKTYTYSLTNEIVRRNLKIVKVDSETGKTIPLAGFQFKLKDSNGNFVTQTNKKDFIDTFVTNESGTVTLPAPLVYGTYKIVEISVAEGSDYLLNTKEIEFKVNKDSTNPITIEFQDTVVKGNIIVHKTGAQKSEVTQKDSEYGPLYKFSYEQKPLGNAVFDIIAKDDIITGDGTIRYKQGEVVDTITSNSDGSAKSKDLYLGTYIIKERPMEGFVTNSESYEVTLKYKDQSTSIVSSDISCTNIRTKYNLQLKKMAEEFVFDAENPTITPSYDIVSGEGFVFGLYTAEEIEGLPSNALLGIYTTDEDGNINETVEVPYGKYYFKELQCKSDDYILDQEKYYVDFNYDSADGEIKVIPVNDGEPIINKLKKERVIINKENEETKEPVEDSEIAINNQDGTTIYTGTTNEKGQIEVELPKGQYTYIETKTPSTYSLNPNSFQLEVADNQEVKGNLDFADDIVRIIIHKIDDDKKPLAGVEFTLFNEDGKKFGTYTTDKNGEFEITQLPYGNYILKETKTLPGYKLLEKEYKFTIDDQHLNSAEPIVFTNYKIVIPQTGHNIIIWIAVAMLSTLGVVIFYNKYKQNK